MKKIALIIFALLFIKIAKAQNVDSTSIKLDQLKKGMIYMRENLNKSQKEFSTGVAITAVGTGVSIAGALMDSQDDKQALVLGIGSLVQLVGIITILDSRKFIGRAGKWKFSGSGIVIDL